MKNKLLLLLLLLPLASFAQEEDTEPVDPCVQNIEIAQQRYNEGRIQDIQQLLTDCLNSGTYDKAQKSQALRLITLAYIFLEDDEKAEETMLELLHANHEFRVDPSVDPTEFINLHEQFRYKPLFNIGVKYTFNISQPIVTQLNSSLDLNSSLPEYQTEIGILGLGLTFEYELLDNLMLYPEIHYRAMKIHRQHTQEGPLPDPDTNQPATILTSINYENQNWLSVPVSAKYILNLKNMPVLKFYVNLGASMDILLSSEKPGDLSYLQVRNSSNIGSTHKTTNDKNRLNFGLINRVTKTVKCNLPFGTRSL